ncbi:dienelactone hydrolase family protein [Tessaracoccus sp. OH4464_COT-324]|uniref:dienelactone hydrolase family protein n=1 Tax=Tessaracoccus sp. OH4464_COT-324 TaxID=2491059 RepID=UPI000F639C02|nr:dienelactone hydrolase family protein [Tessaracoccus sp. OH4464_COT-324]RRD46733.1 dienelactone hydrolase [Tessaracoccus sp. OH4464_COT-324]
MTEIVLFHHALGLTDGVRQFADQLRSRGFAVRTPDLFEGRVFSSVEEAFQYVERVSCATLLQRAEESCVEIHGRIIFGGFSLGVVPAQHMMLAKPSIGGLLFHGFTPFEADTSDWPQLPMHVYAMAEDPLFVGDGDIEAVREAQAVLPQLELHLFEGRKHLFTDSSTGDYDAFATQQVLDHVIDAVQGMRAASPI